MKAIKFILLIIMAVIMSGCVVTTKPDLTTMTILNERLSNIEKEVKKRPSQPRNDKLKVRKLTESLKDFMLLMMDYLGDKK